MLYEVIEVNDLETYKYEVNTQGRTTTYRVTCNPNGNETVINVFFTKIPNTLIPYDVEDWYNISFNDNDSSDYSLTNKGSFVVLSVVMSVINDFAPNMDGFSFIANDPNKTIQEKKNRLWSILINRLKGFHEIPDEYIPLDKKKMNWRAYINDLSKLKK